MDDNADVAPEPNIIPDIEAADAGGEAPMSIYESVEAAFNEMKAPESDSTPDAEEGGEEEGDPEKEVAAEKETEAAEKKAAKEAEAAAEKPAKTPTPAPEEPAQPKEPAEGKAKIEAPETFSEKAKVKWDNVPHLVREEVQRTITEHSKQIEAVRPILEKYESIRPYADMADAVGQPLAKALENYVGMERTLSQNPMKGLNDIIRNYLPAKSDGSPMTLFDVAQYVTGIGQQGLNQALTQAQVQERQQMAQEQERQRVESLQRENANLHAKIIRDTVTKPFEEDHEHYTNPDVQMHIVKIVESGILDDIPRPQDMLLEAYNMAVLRLGLQSSSKSSKAGSVSGATEKARAGNFGGDSPQVKSSPGAAASDRRQSKVGASIRDSIAEAMNEIRSH